MKLEDQKQIVCNAIWRLIGTDELKGLSPYEAAKKVGANDDLARLVAEGWDGPNPIK